MADDEHAAADRAAERRAADGDERELVAVGRIGRPRGVHGECFVEPWTDDPAGRFVAGVLLATDPGTAGPLRVAAASESGGKLVVRFEGVADRDAVVALRGVRLLIEARDRPPLDDPDEFYDTELIGLAARTTDGRPVGPVRDVLHAGGADYLVLAVADREVLVPFVAAIVPTVDVAAGVVEIDPPDGLFEL